MKKMLFLSIGSLIFLWGYSVYSAVIAPEDKIIRIDRVILEPGRAIVVYKVHVKGFEEFYKREEFSYSSDLTERVYSEAIIFINQRRESE